MSPDGEGMHALKTLVLGGARSGKSAHGEQLVPGHEHGPVTYVATARPWPGDQDFSRRIAAHVARRPHWWDTEDRIDAVELLHDPPRGTILVDDLGTWLTHTIDRAQAWDAAPATAPREAVSRRCDALVAAVSSCPPDRRLILISPEVGMSVIPEHPSGRYFRDTLGALNAAIASVCERVQLVVAGCALDLKPPAGGAPPQPGC